jgi:hypothetical protein
MTTKNVAAVEIRFSSSVASLKNIDGERRVEHFGTHYIVTFDDGSQMRVGCNLPRKSKVFNTAEFTCGIRDLLSEFARSVEAGKLSGVRLHEMT